MTLEKKCDQEGERHHAYALHLALVCYYYCMSLPYHDFPDTYSIPRSGVIQLLSLLAGLAVRVLPNGVHRITKSWGRPGRMGADLSTWPTDFSRGILPIPCHSHNDYWRTVPFYSAIEAGCTGVEADIWLFGEHLYVGHSIASLTPNRTINSLYINPLLDVLFKQNPKDSIIPELDSGIHGVFDTNPELSLIFLIDFKTAGDSLWPYVQSALKPLRSRKYLTRFNGTSIIPGPITIVGTGNTPFDMVISDRSNPHHDIFFDAPLGEMFEDEGINSPVPDSKTDHRLPAEPLQNETVQTDPTDPDMLEESISGRYAQQKRSDHDGQGMSGITAINPDVFHSGNSYYASVAFGKAIGSLDNGQFSPQQMELLRGQIRGAHRRGLKARYWDLPFWPIGLRNHVWDVLVREGVDMLNVDDLKGATKMNWDKHNGWWKATKNNDDMKRDT